MRIELKTAAAEQEGNRLLDRLRIGIGRFAIAGALVVSGAAVEVISFPSAAEAACSGSHCDPQGTVELSGSSWLSGGGVDIKANNGSASYDSNVWETVNTVGGTKTTGEEWQCVELINRLYLTKGWTTDTWTGNGDTLKDHLPSGITYQSNGSVTDISPGDVLTLDDGSYGHAGIINSYDPSTGAVDIVNQNTASVHSSATLSNKSLTMSGWAGYTVQGIAHHPTASGGGGPVGFANNIIAAEPTGPNSVKYMVGLNMQAGIAFQWDGTSLTNNTTPTKMVVGDVMSADGNPDNRSDILATEPNGTGGVKYLVGRALGGGLFEWDGTNLNNMTPPVNLAVGDVNGDKKYDILATEPNGPGVRYMLGLSHENGAFDWYPTNLTLNTTPTQMALGQVMSSNSTPDRNADIVATEPNGTGGVQYMVGLSNGGTQFDWRRSNLVNNTPPVAMALGDVNHDGVDDIVAAEPNGQGGVRYMVGLSDDAGHFNWQITNLANNTTPTNLAVGDLNDDGYADIVATEPSGQGGVNYMVGIKDHNDTTFNWQPTNLVNNTPPAAGIGLGVNNG